MNADEHHFAYTYTNTKVSASNVLTYASEDFSAGATEMVGVQGGELPYWKVHDFSGLHALTAYGTNGSSTISEWDPLAQSWAGRHTITTAQTATAMNAGKNGQVWKWPSVRDPVRDVRSAIGASAGSMWPNQVGSSDLDIAATCRMHARQSKI